MAERHRVHLGIDYGTSTSKVVFRDYRAPGREKAYVVCRGGTFRIPSSVALSASDLTFGIIPSASRTSASGLRWYESIKMRVAGETKGDYERYCYGPLPALPFGLTAKDLAVLTVWFLISEGHRAVRKHLGSRAAEVALGMTMGIPMGFYTDTQLRAVFLEIARAAWRIYRTKGILEGSQVQLQPARKMLDEAYKATNQIGTVPLEEVRDWIRSEAEAAVWWPFQSPAIADGPYAKIDIGAGTTNSSIFRIVARFRDGHWVKERLAFFGACSHPVGMDAVDRALAECQSPPRENCLALRGQEEMLLHTSVSKQAIGKVLQQIHNVYRNAWTLAVPRLQGYRAEWDKWKDHSIFILGGGSLVEAIRDAVRWHPRLDIRRQLEVRKLEQPTDLEMHDGGQVPEQDLPFVTVAYGLSNIGLAIPEAETPDEIPPLPSPKRVRDRLDRDDIYAK